MFYFLRFPFYSTEQADQTMLLLADPHRVLCRRQGGPRELFPEKSRFPGIYPFGAPCRAANRAQESVKKTVTMDRIPLQEDVNVAHLSPRLRLFGYSLQPF